MPEYVIIDITGMGNYRKEHQVTAPDLYAAAKQICPTVSTIYQVMGGQWHIGHDEKMPGRHIQVRQVR